MGAYQVVILNANSHQLRITEPIRRRMAPPARIVMMEGMKLIEPQQASKVGKFRIDRAAKICLQALVKHLLNVASESRSREHSRQIPIQFAVVAPRVIMFP
jgi:hypothetical protein